jgi:transcriptional regulator with XRE-family HTH domain
MLGLKQDALAIELGADWNQKRVSLLEAKEVIDPELLDQVAKALRVPVEGIKNFNEEALFNIIGNNYHDNSSSIQYQCTFNPIDKLIEVFEENKKLYEQLLASEREKVELLKGK